MERRLNISASSAYRFGLFELDPEAVELRRDGRRIPLQDLPFRLLLELLRAPGVIISRDELRRALWPEDVHVDFDGSLNAAIRRVRDALGDSAKDPRYLETVPKRGYRFLAPVSGGKISAAPEIPENPEPASDSGSKTPRSETPRSETPRSETHDQRADETAASKSKPAGERWAPRPALWPLALALVGLILWLLSARWAPQPNWPDEPRRLAVLSLEAIGEDERLGPIAAGLTDEIVVHVGNLAPEYLRVVAPTSVRRAQADGDDIPEIARRLDVGFVLAGTLRLEDDRLRVTARLVRAESESLMWATSLERRFESLLDVQRELADRLGEGLRRELLGGRELLTDPASPAAAISKAVSEVASGSKAAPISSTDPRADSVTQQAYEHFLRARHFLALQTPESFYQAERELQEAIRLAPTFADAWAALGTTRALLGIYDLERPKEIFPRAEESIERALELDPGNADAFLARGIVEASFHWRLDDAENHIRRALELSPQQLSARHWLGLLLQAQGRDREAQAELAIARRHDPLSLTLRLGIGWCHFLAGRTDDAIAEAKGVLELDADYLVAWDDLKWFYTVAGRDTEAAEAFFRVVELEGDGDAVAYLRELHAREGFRGLLEESLVSHLRSAAGEGYQSPYDIVIAAAALGRVSEALDWLERSFEEREVDWLGSSRDPRLDPLRDEDRFKALMARFESTRSALERIP